MVILDYLVKHGANIHAGDDRALKLAASKGYAGTVMYLVEHGANINPKDSSVLREAVTGGYFDLVRYLVEHGANIYNQDVEVAKRNRHMDIAQYLIEQSDKMVENKEV